MATMVTQEPTTSSPSKPETPPQQPAQTPSVDWTSAIPKGSEKVFESFKGKGLQDVLNGYVEAQRMIGGSIRLPSEKDTPEQREAKLRDIRMKLGMPESPDKYDIGDLPQIHESFKWDDERLNAAKAELHKAGFTNDQVKVALGLFAKEMSAFFPDHEKSAAEARQALIEHYGDQKMFERNLGFAHKAVKEYGDEELVAWLEQTGVGNSPAFVKFMAKIGKELVEHGAVEPASEIDYISQEDAQKKINEVMNDKNDLYWARPGTPGKAERMKEVESWYKIIAGEA